MSVSSSSQEALELLVNAGVERATTEQQVTVPKAMCKLISDVLLKEALMLMGQHAQYKMATVLP